MTGSFEMKVHEQVRAARREAYRDAILEAALSLFAEQGFRAITMTDIAKAAGVAKGTLYNYFDSKEEVFAELAQRGREVFLDGFDEAISEHEGWDRILAAVRYTLEFLVANANMVNVYLEATGGARDSNADPGRGVFEQAFFGRLNACFERLARRGQLRDDMPVDLLATCLSGLIDSVARNWMSSGKGKDLPETAHSITRLFRQGAEA